MIEAIPYWCRILLLFLLMSLVAAIDWLRNRQKPTKWKEYGFVIVSGAIGTLFGFFNDLKPEAASFLASNGKRTAMLFVEMQDASQIPALAEPWFLAFQASIEMVPVMIPEDLKKARPAIEQAVKKYGR